jgi:hypothetical protein
MSIDQPVRPSSVPFGAIIVLSVAIFLYAGMMANLGEMQNHNTDAMGRGMASGFALVLVLAEWFFLAILLLIGGVKGEMPVWSAMTALILLPLSGIAAINALTLLDHDASPAYQLVPGLLAPIIGLYAMWARLSVLHRVLPPLPTSLAAWSAVAILSLVPVLHPF